MENHESFEGLGKIKSRKTFVLLNEFEIARKGHLRSQFVVLPVKHRIPD